MSEKNKIEEFAGGFKALSNPNRLRIFLRLADCCPSARTKRSDKDVCACVGELGKDLDIAPSTVSHHIKELRQAGLICMERKGQNIECRVDRSTLRDLKDFFEAVDRKE